VTTTAYVALLRGINVGGHTVKMERLRGLFGELGFTRVRSYIQTGNLFFESDASDRRALRARIEQHLHAALGYEVAACLRTVAELSELLACDRFGGRTVTAESRLAVTFLAEPVSLTLPLPYVTADGAFEVVGMTPTELFVVWRLRDGRPGNWSPFEKLAPAPMTTRFWHTAAKILAAAQRSAG
jgi:uncharacterized protein (DUF1697 family)